MKLSTAFSILLQLHVTIQIALVPTFWDILSLLALLFHLTALSHTFVAHLWILFGKGIDENGRPVKEQLITPHAHGVVLDIGAGHIIIFSWGFPLIDHILCSP
jgi:hypothetical protein